MSIQRKNSGQMANIIALLVVVAVIALALWLRPNHQKSVTSVSKKPNTTQKTVVAFDKKQFSTDDPASHWVVVNKGRVLPSDYAPADLVVPAVSLRVAASSPEMTVRKDTAAAMEKMFADAAKQGLQLMLTSGYRSYTEQVDVYQQNVKASGQAHADSVSAHPGHSEHQTGWAADLEPASRTCELEVCFGERPEGKWLAANSYKYGFIIRYEKGKESLTGYNYEPWHIRFVGLGLASELHSSGQTMEQFFGLPTYTDYPTTSYQLKVHPVY